VSAFFGNKTQQEVGQNTDMVQNNCILWKLLFKMSVFCFMWASDISILHKYQLSHYKSNRTALCWIGAKCPSLISWNAPLAHIVLIVQFIACIPRGNLPVSLLKPTRKWIKLQFIEWPHDSWGWLQKRVKSVSPSS